MIDYRLGAPRAGRYIERLNSDSELYGGSNLGNGGAIETTDTATGRFACGLTITVPPLAALVFEYTD